MAVQNSVQERKRRGAPLENIPEAKRPTGRAAATAGRPAAAAAAPAAKAPAPEETWEDIAERTGAPDQQQ